MIGVFLKGGNPTEIGGKSLAGGENFRFPKDRTRGDDVARFLHVPHWFLEEGVGPLHGVDLHLGERLGQRGKGSTGERKLFVVKVGIRLDSRFERAASSTRRSDRRAHGGRLGRRLWNLRGDGRSISFSRAARSPGVDVRGRREVVSGGSVSGFPHSGRGSRSHRAPGKRRHCGRLFGPFQHVSPFGVSGSLGAAPSSFFLSLPQRGL